MILYCWESGFCSFKKQSFCCGRQLLVDKSEPFEDLFKLSEVGPESLHSEVAILKHFGVRTLNILKNY